MYYSPFRHISIQSAIEEVIAAGRSAANRGWTPATSGNFSVRVEDAIVITRTGRDKSRLNSLDVAVVPFDDPVDIELSAEAALHFARYRADPSVGAMFHAHIPLAAALSRRYAENGHLVFSGWEIQKGFANVNSHFDSVRVPIIENKQDTQAPAATAELALSREQSSCLQAPGYLIAGHGINAWGRTARDAQRHLETFDALLTIHKLSLELRDGQA